MANESVCLRLKVCKSVRSMYNAFFLALFENFSTLLKLHCFWNSDSRNGEVSTSKHGDWARAECNPCISFLKFLQSCYYWGWRHYLLSPRQEDTPSWVINSPITFHFYVLVLYVHQCFLPFAGKLDAGDQACGISVRDLRSDYYYLLNVYSTWYLFLKLAIYQTGWVCV